MLDETEEYQDGQYDEATGTTYDKATGEWYHADAGDGTPAATMTPDGKVPMTFEEMKARRAEMAARQQKVTAPEHLAYEVGDEFQEDQRAV